MQPVTLETPKPLVKVNGVRMIDTVILPQNQLDEFVELYFNDRKHMCFAQWDEYLHRKYHDYMQFPPKEEQVWKHHPVIVDFEHNYEELSGN